jgi:hypothetical protein
MARRAVAKLVASHLIPSGKFGRKRALRNEGQRELGCAIRQASAAQLGTRAEHSPVERNAGIIQRHIGEALRQSFEAVTREPVPPQMEALIMQLALVEAGL